MFNRSGGELLRGYASYPFAKARHRNTDGQTSIGSSPRWMFVHRCKHFKKNSVMNAAPLLVSFSDLNKFIVAMSHSQRDSYQDEINTLISKSFPPVVSESCLALLFGYSTDFVYAMSKKQDKFYRTFTINSGKKVRKIHSPKVALKVIQKWIAEHLSRALTFEPHVTGFVKGKSFADAAYMHIGATWVLSRDIKDFFPSVKEDQVINSLRKIGYSEQGATLVARLSCLKGVLAQGSPLSPVLSNLVLKEVDGHLLKLSKQYSVTMSRYADDIVISGKDYYNSEIEQELDKVFEQSSFNLNKNKVYFADATKGQRLKVHGLLLKSDKITLTKGYRNKLRAYKHMLDNKKVCEDDLPRIIGHVKYMEFINSKSFSK